MNIPLINSFSKYFGNLIVNLFFSTNNYLNFNFKIYLKGYMIQTTKYYYKTLTKKTELSMKFLLAV
jgi:hypothetical protein